MSAPAPEPILLLAEIAGVGCQYRVEAADLSYERFDVYVQSGPSDWMPEALLFDSFRDAVLHVLDQIDADVAEATS